MPRAGVLDDYQGIALGMSVIAWSQNLTAEQAVPCGATLVTKDEPRVVNPEARS
jgi:hypothetical protein